MENNQKKKETWTTRNLLIIAVILLSAILIISAATLAQNIITAPEHVTGTPVPTPTPTATPTTAELHLTSNNTDPFYIGDTLHMEAALTPAQSGITVTLYNNGNFVTTNTTDTTGVATFDRLPTNPYDYTASAELP